MWKCKECGGEVMGTGYEKCNAIFTVDKNEGFEEMVCYFNSDFTKESHVCQECGVSSTKIKDIATWEDLNKQKG